MRPDPHARPEYIEAFREIASRIERSLQGVDKRALPVRMYVAGGAALHLYTGERVSADIDAVFSRRIALPEMLEVAYRDADGSARLLYFDRQYNDTLGLMHEEAYEDSVPLALKGIDRRILDIRLLTPLDLAVSKIGRFTEIDRADIASLARRGSVKSGPLRKRAEEALGGYVGDVERLRGSIRLACRLVEDIEHRRARRL